MCLSLRRSKKGKGRSVRLATKKWAELDPPRKIPTCGPRHNDNVYTVEHDGELGKTVGRVLDSKYHSGRSYGVEFPDDSGEVYLIKQTKLLLATKEGGQVSGKGAIYKDIKYTATGTNAWKQPNRRANAAAAASAAVTETVMNASLRTYECVLTQL